MDFESEQEAFTMFLYYLIYNCVIESSGYKSSLLKINYKLKKRIPMKKQILLLLFVFLMISGKVMSQTSQLTPGGFFDNIFDQYGNQYQFANLSLTSYNKYNGGTINALP